MARGDLIRWLAALDPATLSGLLARRPDVLTGRGPRDLEDLADRLAQRIGVAEVLPELPLPAVQLIEAVSALTPAGPPPSRLARPEPDDGVELTRLAALLGREPDDPELAATLSVLAQRALAWSLDGRVFLAAPLAGAFPRPFQLGRPAVELLTSVSGSGLRAMARRLGMSPERTSAVKPELLVAVADRLAEHGAEVAREAPEDIRVALLTLAAGPPRARVHSVESVRWALDRGLLVLDGYDLVELPREVGLALRGPGWRPPFAPLPPAPALAPALGTAVADEAGLAAGVLLERLLALVQLCATAPVTQRKSGGVGVRELSRVAKALGVDKPAVILLLEMAAAAGLIAPGASGLLPTEEFDDWSAREPADQLAVVLAEWFAMPAAPLVDGTDAALMADNLGPAAAQLRPVLLRALDELPPGLGVLDPASFFALVRWSAPLPLHGLDEPQALVEAVWRELTAVGAVALGAVSPLGRALAEGTPLVEAAARLLHSAQPVARLQADLTAVVAGTPAPALRALLDAAAEREVRGAASVWRFTPASVRRALDAGMSTVELLDRLREVAGGGGLPQPLEYLIGDVARRHGAMRVRAVGCVVHSDDLALVAELAAVKGLGLAVLAPTVLVSAAGPAETVAALRAKGYAPLAEDGTGAVVVQRPAAARADRLLGRRRPGGAAGGGAPVRRSRRPAAELDALAARLLSHRPVPLQRDLFEELDPFGHIRKRAPQLPPSNVRLLAAAVERGTPVGIRYTDGHGEASVRVIEAATLDGQRLSAWCHLRDDERAFSLDRIDAVFPV